jgi:pimeloyl-ACP methyl ester carboxylesterase
VLDDVGHYPMFEAPERVAELTERFLRKKKLLAA